MGRKWNNALADVTAGFPAAVWSGDSIRNKDLNGYEVANEVIGASLWTLSGGRYRAYLDMVPLEQSSFLCRDTSTGNTVLTPIPWGETPASTEVAVSLETGAVEVHSTRAGNNIRFDYRGHGSDVQAGIVNRVIAELVAAQAKLLSLETEVDAKQAADALLTAIAGLSTVADRLIYTTGTDTVALAALTSFARTLLSQATQADAQVALGVRVGVEVQAWNQVLASLAGNSNITAGNVPFFDGSLTTSGRAPSTSFGRSLLNAADAAALRTLAALGSLATASTINNGNWSGTALAIANGGTGATSASAARTALGLGSVATRDGDALTQRMNPITVGGSDRTLLAAESGSLVICNDAGNALLPAASSCSNGWFRFYVTAAWGGAIESLGGAIHDPAGNFTDANPIYTGGSSEGSLMLFSNGTKWITGAMIGNWVAV